MSGQLALLPSEPPELRRESLPLELIDGFADAAPSAKLRELVRDLGLLQPVVVLPARSGRFRVVEGRRRCKAIEQLGQEGQWPVPPHIDALVIQAAQAGHHEVRGGLTLALHASRSASPASELQTIKAILRSSASDGETAAVREIAAQTGMSLQTVRRRLRLRSLVPGIRAAFDEGRITASVAEAAARLPGDRQIALERQLEEEGRVTLADLRRVAREQTAAATAQLPDGLFEQQRVAWLVTVRGHLTAALHAIPTDEEHDALRQIVGEAMAAAESVDAEGQA